MHSKQIIPSGVRGIAVGEEHDPTITNDSKTVTSDGRHYSINPTATPIIPVSPQHSSERQGSPRSFSATALSASSTKSPSVLEMGAVTNFTEENVTRRNFFFQLKGALANSITENMNRWVGSNTSVAINNDNYDAITNEDHGKTLWDCCNVFTLGIPYLCCSVSNASVTNEIQPNIKYFANRIALALVYIYQDYIPILTPGSYKDLIDYFTAVVICYCFPTEYRRSPDDYRQDDDKPSDFKNSNIYRILMHSLNIYELGVTVPKPMLKFNTIDGFEFSIKHLFSTGVRTYDGGKLEPYQPESRRLFEELKSRDKFHKFPLYRWGTMDAYYLKGLSYRYVGDNPSMRENDLKIVEGNPQTKLVGGKLVTSNDANKTVFWQNVEELAHHYLTEEELKQLRELKQIIPGDFSD